MKIARVKLSGFKSFVDPVELRIMPGLTGVVGPNGCGKSNLLEAIRWAMGEGSAKSLRGGAMDDVIFAGTATRPQRQFAEVSILAERDDDDVEVTRRIERGAGSAYRINGRDARARDAQLLFADAAAGAHSPALVSQGKIGAVIAAKPAERRAMLEEAAGIAGLHVRRREAEIRLKATEANLTRVGEVLAEMETRCGQLRRQARAAERYRGLSDAIRVAEGRLIYARWRDAAAAADAARAEVHIAELAVADAAEMQRVAAALSHDALDKLTMARTAAQSERDAAADARHALADAESEQRAVVTRITTLARERERLADDITRERELSHDAVETLARLKDEINAHRAWIATTVSERPILVGDLDIIERANREAEVALAQTLAKQARQDAERRVAGAALAAASHALERTMSAVDRLVGERDRLPPSAEAEAHRDTVIRQREDAERAMAVAIGTLADCEVAQAKAIEARASAHAEAAAAHAQLASVEGEARALTETTEESGGAIDRIRADPGFEAALAAALTDDLAAAVGDGEAARRWLGATTRPDDPALTAGPALADFVDAPTELSRRLRQIAVVACDEGQTLAVGQRIVTRDGRMRRWDGFIADSAASATAERLRRRNRLAVIDALLPNLRRAAGDSDSTVIAAQQSLADANIATAAARRARDAADAAGRAALRAEDSANAEVERRAARHRDIAAQLASAAQDTVRAKTAEAEAHAKLAALPPDERGDVLAELERSAADLRAQVTEKRSALATLDQRIDDKRQRLATAEHDERSWRSRDSKGVKRIEDLARRAQALDAEADTLVDAPDVAGRAVVIARDAAAAATAATEATAAAERAAEAKLREREAAALRIGETLSAARETRAGAVARAESQELRRVEMGRVSGERFECPPPVLPEKLGFAETDVGAVGAESARLESLTLDRERLGPVNLVAASELAELEGERAQQAAEVAELTEATHRLRGSIGSLNREGRVKLRSAFEAVDGHFRRLFRTLFNGGEAHLELIDSDDPLEAGLEIMAQPPGKKLTSLTLLSGGEQALTAVALIFALFLTNPAPLCVLDEVDAPLDDANVERFCDLLDAMARTTATRYLIVTHNAVTMARMHRLYGVTMVEQGISRLVSVDLGGATELLVAQ